MLEPTTPRPRVPEPVGPAQRAIDQGSITPLVLGMVLCLLILSAGVIAAGSAFLGGQRVQQTCDGAARAGADALAASLSYSGYTQADPAVEIAINRYLAVRHSDIAASFSITTDTVQVTCSADVPITFGAIVNSPTLERTVTSASTAEYGFVANR